MSYTVTLPDDVEHKFPPRCVVCNESYHFQPAIFGGSAAAQKGFCKWFVGDSSELNIPIHPHCAEALDKKSFWNTIGYLPLIVILPIVWFTLKVNEVPLPFELNETNLCIAGFIFFLPLYFWEEKHPLEFKRQVGEESIYYEFKDFTYANEFKMLNWSKEEYAEWLKEKALDSVRYAEYEDMIEITNKYIEVNPQDYLGFKFRSLALRKMGRFEESLRDREKSKALYIQKKNNGNQIETKN